jgi:hypothetical protein
LRRSSAISNRFRIDERNFETNAAEIENHIQRTIEMILLLPHNESRGLSALIEPMEAR